jgi:chromosome segregation ATPase
MTVTSSKPANPSFLTRFKRPQAWKEYAGYYVGDIYENQPVAIPPGATIVGQVTAPQIMVLGVLAGSAVGRDVVISDKGQIWGDIFAVHFHMESGGKIRGWVNSITETEFTDLADGAVLLAPENGDTPSDLKAEHKRVLDKDRLDALRQLQTETAVALAARTELEESFDQRLSEIAGDAANQLTLIREELKASQTQLIQVQQEADALTALLQTRDAQIKRQSEELLNTQDLLAQTTETLEKIQTVHAQKEEAFAQLQAAKAGADTHLEEALNHVDTLTGRVHNIETALQASLSHSSDQEDALIRWQELAESTEKRAEELQIELEKAKRQIQENYDVTALLSEQRKQLEKEWGEAQMRIDELEQQLQTEADRSQSLLAKSDEAIQSLVSEITLHKKLAERTSHSQQELLDEISGLKEQITTKEAEVADARLHYRKLHVRWKETSAQLEAIQKQPTRLLSTERQDNLVKKLTEAEERAEQYHEQMVWNQAGLENTRTELNQIRAYAEEQEAHSQQLAAENHKQQEKLRDLQQELQTLKQQREQQEKQTAQEKENLKQSVRAQRAQLDASEKDLARYLTETEQQGKRLAEIQAALIEREIELQETRQIVAKQQKFIKQMQEVTKAKIQDLQTQLAQTRK